MTSTDEGESLKQERVKARWSILRNALLQKTQTTKHSIHRYAGFQLIRPSSNPDLLQLQQQVQVFHWNDSDTVESNLMKLEVAVLSVSACGTSSERSKLTVFNSPSDKAWISKLKFKVLPPVKLVEERPKDNDPKHCITFLLQPIGGSTKFQVCQYKLQDLSLWTREPLETRLRLEDLITHRRSGVDNTGNICVWDSERSLSFLLFEHLDDFPFLMGARKILELGTGMAGLAAVCLALALVIRDRSKGISDRILDVTLTDGHADGIKNNEINRYLTKLYATATSGPNHPYECLRIRTQLLLWTVDGSTTEHDVVLISDCVHFQEYHAALALTTLRSLRIGGTAIFCQPTRGNSLDNFVALLNVCQRIVDGLKLLSLTWMTHPRLEAEKKKAKEEHQGIFDENLHCPRILLVEKLRGLSSDDCNDFISHQKNRKLTKTRADDYIE